MASQATQVVTRQVRPVLSLTKNDARKRVIALYKAWYRQIPKTMIQMDLAKTEDQCRDKLKEEFMKNKDVKDLRVIDFLIVKGQMELKEVTNHWKQKGHVMSYWKDTVNSKPKDFLSKFLESKD